jgi:hypothetical protein
MNRLPLWINRRNGRSALAGAALLLGGALLVAQDAPAPLPAPPRALGAGATPSFTAFQVIGNYNIFNANRIGYVPGSTAVRVDTISLVGTMQYDNARLALFDSPDREFRKGVREGDRIADFTVTKITDTGVVLTRESKALPLAMGQQLRRPPGGAWTVGLARRAEPAAAAAQVAPAIPADASDIIKQLMEQRQKLQKQ